MNEYYQNILKKFLSEYEKLHVNPWHNISLIELEKICKHLLLELKVNDDYSFKYFMDFIIKRLDGVDDSHTKYRSKAYILPYNYRIFDDEVIVNYPEKMKGSKLESINDVDINDILRELDNIIIYGTDGKRRYELEKALFDLNLLFCLPSLRNSTLLNFKFKDVNGKIIVRKFSKEDRNDTYEKFSIDEYYYGNPGTYRIEDNVLIYNHSSIQNEYKEKIFESIESLRSLDLKDIDRIIIDLRGNIGGNSLLNKPLVSFLNEHVNKDIIVLTDYKVFSSARLCLIELINLGATTVGEEIGTPLNSYGEQCRIDIEGFNFTISTCYLNPIKDLRISNKDDIRSLNGSEFEPVMFFPDYYVKTIKDDYLIGKDSVLEFAKNVDLRNKISIK